MAKKDEAPKSKLLAGTVFIDTAAFDSMEGETFAGLNILKLSPGQAAGPITIKKILPKQILGKDTAAKKRKPVDVYVGEFNGTEIRLPVAASLIMKFKDANVGVGDVVAIKRDVNYATKHDGKNGDPRGQAYLLKVISRANAKK